MLISTPKKAFKHLHKIKNEMHKALQDRQDHEIRKMQPKKLSLVDHMNSMGFPSHFTARQTLAKKFGMKKYAGTSHENERLLAIINPHATA